MSNKIIKYEKYLLKLTFVYNFELNHNYTFKSIINNARRDYKPSLSVISVCIT